MFVYVCVCHSCWNVWVKFFSWRKESKRFSISKNDYYVLKDSNECFAQFFFCNLYMISFHVANNFMTSAWVNTFASKKILVQIAIRRCHTHIWPSKKVYIMFMVIFCSSEQIFIIMNWIEMANLVIHSEFFSRFWCQSQIAMNWWPRFTFDWFDNDFIESTFGHGVSIWINIWVNCCHCNDLDCLFMLNHPSGTYWLFCVWQLSLSERFWAKNHGDVST